MAETQEQQLMRQACHSYIDDVVLPFIRNNWQREWDMNPGDRLGPEILEGADRIGIRTLGIPEEFGGIELDPATEVQTFGILGEEVARGDSGLADKLSQNWKVSLLLRNLAPRHLQEYWFKRIVEDPQFLLANCATEPGGASDRWLPYNVPKSAMRTKAVRDGNEWVINGRKQFISNGYDAKLYVVLANTKLGAAQCQLRTRRIQPSPAATPLVAEGHERPVSDLMASAALAAEAVSRHRSRIRNPLAPGDTRERDQNS